jgi:hypothetical protein
MKEEYQTTLPQGMERRVIFTLYWGTEQSNKDVFLAQKRKSRKSPSQAQRQI